MKKFLGLDIGTNSIGWALIEQDFENKKGKIIKTGSRIIPMSQDVLDKFADGQSISQTAERTRYRSVRKLYERRKLRRERLHRVLYVLGFLPEHYAGQIDRYGKFLPGKEHRLAYDENNTFIFKDSYEEMLEDFKKHQPQLLINIKGEPALIPYDWTIYYLRKKALTQKVNREELAWLLLHFNQKRGYYQLREALEEEQTNKLEEYHSLKITNIEDTGDKKTNGQTWYNVHLENGWIYRRASHTSLNDWIGKTKDFIITTEVDEQGNIKQDKEGQEKRSFRAPNEDDWTLIKKKTEIEIERSDKHPGTFIYDHLLMLPAQKIRGKLIRTIERKYYNNELKAILEKQQSLHQELQDAELYNACLNELYPHNEAHKAYLQSKDFIYLFVEDIVFYQRPLKSKKSTISGCRFEKRKCIKDGKTEWVGVKCIPKSHPLFQEFRLWQWIDNLRILERKKESNGKLVTDDDITDRLLSGEEDWTALFEFLFRRKEVTEKNILKHFGLNEKTHRWNYIEKSYPCNETRWQILGRLNKLEDVPVDFLSRETEEKLWHVLYSVNDPGQLEKALGTFARKHQLDEQSFIAAFRKLPAYPKAYGAFSANAIKKLLPLMRRGKYWQAAAISPEVRKRIDPILTGEYDESIDTKVRELTEEFRDIDDFKGLPLWLASYVVYGRHAEMESDTRWKSPGDINTYLESFKQHSLRNPVVEQVITETLRTVKDIWQEFGEGKEAFFDEIHLELGRDMKNNADDRKRITRQQNQNENTNLRIKAILKALANDTEMKEVRPHSPSQQEALKIYEDGVISGFTDQELKQQRLSGLNATAYDVSKKPNPTHKEILKYKLWLEQKYRSPYTGEIIPLNELFTPKYEIEHVIPQSRYFDDSFSNKVLCESAVNPSPYKGNQLGYEFIKSNKGERQVPELSSKNRTVRILSPEEYERFVTTNYRNNRAKMKKLLMEEIPEKFIERQINDTRYISKYLMQILSNIVREPGETDSRAKKMVVCTGGVTNRLKRDWGLNHIWNDLIAPRFERLNHLTNTQNFGRVNPNTRKFLPEVPLENQKGFSKKRIDHRHHALDAVLIACATADHVNYLNNESHIRKNKNKTEKKELRYDLRKKLRRIEKVQVHGNPGTMDIAKEFLKPWATFTQDTSKALQNTIVSFKQNTRVINNTGNIYEKWIRQADGSMKKEKVKQEKGDLLAIRKPLHKETVYGKVKIKSKNGKSVSVTKALKDPELIVDKAVRSAIKSKLKTLHGDLSQLEKYFKANPLIMHGKTVDKVEVFEWVEGTACRVGLDTSFTEAKIKKAITDSGIQKILLNHLKQPQYQDQKDDKGKLIPPESLAFSPEGIEDMNNNLADLNDGKLHQPIRKIRVYESGTRFPLGETANKAHKYVEAAKGTNLFFAVYVDEEGDRNFETVPLYDVIAHQKQTRSLPKGQRTTIPVNPAKGRLLFTLSPNDLVYVPSEEEIDNPSLIDFANPTPEQVTRIYKMVSSTKYQCMFIRNDIAASIVNKFEFSALNKMERAITETGEMIKEICWKLQVNRLGQITKIIR